LPDFPDRAAKFVPHQKYNPLVFNIIQVLIIAIFPAFALWASKKSGKDWLSPVILSYAAGILLSNLTPLPLNPAISHRMSEGTVLLAIPLLLYSTDILGWFKLAKSTILSFALCVVSGLVMTVFAAWLFKNQTEHVAHLSGMITGIYTGGIPNMNAIGIATRAPESLYIYLNAADVVIGGSYLIFLTSFAPRVFGRLLPTFNQRISLSVPLAPTENQLKRENLKEIGIAFLLTFGIIGVSVALTVALTGGLESVSLIILLLTTFSVLGSLSKKVRTLRGSYDLGDYFLLMFCVAIGMLANFQDLATEGLQAMLFMAVIWVGMVVLHVLLSRWFQIDRDTTMITATAALYGPPFIGQIARVINNRSLVFSGVATGLLGYALGNYLGISIFNLVNMLF